MKNSCLAAALQEVDAARIRDVERAYGGKHLQLRWQVNGHPASELSVSLYKKLFAGKQVDDEITSRYAENGSPARDSEQGVRRSPAVCARQRVRSRGGR
jgi:hypothetical protein